MGGQCEENEKIYIIVTTLRVSQNTQPSRSQTTGQSSLLIFYLRSIRPGTARIGRAIVATGKERGIKLPVHEAGNDISGSPAGGVLHYCRGRCYGATTRNPPGNQSGAIFP
jgi:hypothetical protein